MTLTIDKLAAFSPQQVAELTGLCINTVYKLLADGRLKYIRTNRKILVSRANLTEFLDGETERRKEHLDRLQRP